MLGLFLAGPALIFLGNTSTKMASGVPYFYRPKMIM